MKIQQRKDIEDKTLADLEGIKYIQPPEDTSYLVRNITRLLAKPIKDFSVEDLRITIGQDIGLPYLMPLALEKLEKDPLAEGMHYPGDLLCNVLKASPQYFLSHPEVRGRVKRIAERVPGLLGRAEAVGVVKKALEKAIAAFQTGQAKVPGLPSNR